VNQKIKDGLTLFMILTLAWTWIMGFIPLLMGLDAENSGSTLFKLLAGPAPSIVAIALILFTYTKAQKKDYFKRCFSVKQMGIKWPLLAALFYAAVTVATIFASTTFAGGSMPEFGGIHILAAQPYMIFLYLFLAVVSGPLNEEFGWRGFALDKLFIRFSFWKGSAILGFIWGIWHLPWFFYPGNGQYIAWQTSPIHGIIYIVSTITLSCVVSIVYIKTNRSIMAGAFVHLVSNFLNGSVLIFPFDNTYIITLFYVRIVLEGLVILYFARNAKFRSEVENQFSVLEQS